ncbi:hypothetical protein MRB53_039099 [Persea americana]|nr:hypothetical protein MRB53_039099 [Persea americana]
MMLLARHEQHVFETSRADSHQVKRRTPTANSRASHHAVRRLHGDMASPMRTPQLPIYMLNARLGQQHGHLRLLSTSARRTGSHKPAPSPSLPPPTSPDPSHQTSQRLTHLTSTGEAHIVNVGAKPGHAPHRHRHRDSQLFQHAASSAHRCQREQKRRRPGRRAHRRHHGGETHARSHPPLSSPHHQQRRSRRAAHPSPARAPYSLVHHTSHTPDCGSVFIQARVECVGPPPASRWRP